MASPRLRFGLIGSGYMGRAHAIALHSAAAVFGADYAVECVTLADATAQRAQEAAHLSVCTVCAHELNALQQQTREHTRRSAPAG